MRILLLDDEQSVLNAMSRSLFSEFKVLKLTAPKIDCFTDPLEAIARSTEGLVIDLVISDYRMPVMNGVEFLKRFKAIQPNAIRIILSGQTDFAALVNAINEVGIHHFIAKPWDTEDVVKKLLVLHEGNKSSNEDQQLLNQLKLAQGSLSQQEFELLRLEAETPGITKVKRDADGAIILEL